MRILGMISGTSLDGIDIAVVDIAEAGSGLGSDPLSLEVVAAETVAYPAQLRAALIEALPPAPASAEVLCRLDTMVGQAFADAAERVASRTGGVAAVATHGQTVYHWVVGSRALGTLQIGQPAWIAERLGVPVISDFRSRDVAAGGQGAPLVPLLDELVLAQTGVVAANLNLGGISNMTVVRPGAEPIAYDIGPANALIDSVVRARRLHPAGYDEDGVIAGGGTVSEPVLTELLTEPYYRLPAPKSTGKELFDAAYLDRFPAALRLADADLVATLTALTARTVADDVRAAGIERLYLSGGGAANPVMVGMLVELLEEVTVGTTDELGLPTEAKEAIAFALLGWCTLHGVAGNVPSATGARGPRILGSITPGTDPLLLPEPRPRPAAAVCRVRG